MESWKQITLMLIILFVPVAGFSLSNENIVYQGRIVRPDGSVPNSGTLTFSLSVFSPAPRKCLLYSERQTLNMNGSQGMFSLTLGSGSRIDSGPYSFQSIFVNGATFTGLSCSIGNSYTPAATDSRDLHVSFDDAGSIVSLAPMAIKSVPFALQARQIDGWGLNNLVKVSSIGSPTTFTTDELAKVKNIGALGCAANEILKWNGSGWECATDSTGGALGDAGYGAGNKGAVAFDTDAAASGITVASGIAKLSDTGVSAGTYGALNAVPTLTVDAQGRLSNAVSVPIQITSNQISVSGGTLGQVLKWNGAAWWPEDDLGITSESDPTVQSFAKNAPASRFVTTGNVLDLATSGVSAGTYGSSTQVPVFTVDAFGRVTGVTNTSITGASPVGAALNAAQFWVGDASNLAAAVSLSGDASLFNNGALSINKLQGQTLTLAASPGAGALLTYNTTFSRWEALALPDCTASETLGFNAVSGNYECQTINNATNFTGSLAGDVTGPQGSTTVSRLQGQSLQISSLAARDTLVYNGSAWVNANIPNCGANQYLTFNGSYFCVTDTGSAGVVTSVDVAVPSFMSTSGGPITTSGTISLGLQNQNANLVFAGPASGGAAAPSFRHLASEDIPALDAAKISTGTLPVSRGGTGSGAALNNNKVMVSSGGAIVEGDGFGSVKANNTYVLRDGSGGFAAGAVTVDSSILKGSTSGSLTLQAPASVTSYSLTFPSAVGSLGQVLMTDASGNLSWANPTGGTVTSVSSSNAYLSVANGTSSATLTLNVGTAANTVAAGDDARITGALQRSGGTMSGVLNMGGQDVENTGHLSLAASKYLGMGQFAADPATGGWGASEKGRTWFNTVTNEIKYWDGSAVRTLGVSGSGLQNLNGLTGNNQSFAVGTSGTDFGITSSGSVHTFNLPTASASNRGLLSSSDFTTFTNKLGSSSQFSGDVSGTVSAVTVNRIQGVPVTGSLSANNFLRYNGSAWMGSNLSAGDVTTSLGYTPVNKAGDTMSGALNLNNNDLTAVASMQLKGSTSGTLTLAAPASVTSYTLRFPSAVGSAGQVLATDASGNLSWAAAGSPNSFEQNGNSFGAPAVLGTNDSNSLNFETAGTTRVTVSASGMVGIGTSSPNAPLEIAGSGVKKLILRDDQDGNAQQSIISFEGATDGAHGWVGFASTGDDDLSILAQGANGDLVLGAGNSFSKGLRIKGSSGNVGIGTNSPNTTLDINGAETMRGMAAPAVSPAGQGRIYFDSTANKYKVSQNGGAYVDLVSSGGGGGITSLNGLTDLAQTFAVGSAGTDFAITSSGSTHTFNLPTASASNRGLLSSSDFTTFTNKLSSSSQFAGDVSGTVAAMTVNRIQGVPVTGSLSANNFLKYNGSAWMGSNLTNSDVTTALSYTPVNRAGDTMSGALNLNNNDLTAVASMQLKGATTGTLTLAAPLSVTSYTLRFPSAVGSAGQVLATDASGNLSWATPSTSGGGGSGSLSSLTAATDTNTIDSLNFAQIWNWSTATTQTPMTINANALTTGGILSLASSSAAVNSTNGLLYVGNTGAGTTGLVFRAQSNSTAGSGLSVLANGNVGIGTASPVAKADVQGQVVSREYIVSTGANVDFHNGNTQILQSVGATAIVLTNMVNGGHYTLVIEDTTSRTYSFTGCATTYSVPALAPTSGRSIFSLLKTSTACYITWTTGF